MGRGERCMSVLERTSFPSEGIGHEGMRTKKACRSELREGSGGLV